MANYTSMTRASASPSLSRRDEAIDRALSKVRRQAQKEATTRANRESMTQRLVQTAEVFGTPVALTWLQARGLVPGTVPGTNIPLSLLGGLALRLGAEFLDEDMGSTHVRNVGDGMLAQYGTVLGAQLAGGVRVGGVGQAQVGCGPCAAPMMGAAYGSPAAYYGAPAAGVSGDAEIDMIMRRYGWV